MSHNQNQRVCNIFRLASFTWLICIYVSSIFFYDFKKSFLFYYFISIFIAHFYHRIIFLCLVVPQFVYALTYKGQLDCFKFLVSMNKTAINIPVRVFVWTLIFKSFEEASRNMIAELYSKIRLTFMRTAYLQKYCFVFPPTMNASSHFPMSCG